MQIRVSPDVLRNVAKHQESILNNITEKVSKINDIENQLRDAWEGASGENARDVLEEIRTGIKKTLNSAGDNVTKLIEVADAFESIDNGEKVFAIRQLPNGYIPFVPERLTPFMFSTGGMVRIDTDRVRDIAEQCKSISASISDDSSAFSDSIKNLANDWEGKAYLKYEDETREIINAFREIEEVMNEFIARIVNAANRYEEIDNSF